MRCSDLVRMWDELREGGAAPSREAVLSHLRRCPDCQDAYREYEGVAYCLTCLPVVEPPSGLVPKILEHISSLRPASPDMFSHVRSPIGDLIVAFRESGITAIAICSDDSESSLCESIAKRLRRGLVPAKAPQWVTSVIESYFRTFEADRSKVDISALTEFEQAALRKAAEIPAGEVRSYGWIAREIGQPAAARAVGQAMARNPVPLLYPCHRVVDSTGALHNYAYGLEIKARILAMEGYVPPARAVSASRA
ncbi:MAG: methylated-DNA--[protein]-cysteine S-methyltransferase [Candidatus Eremiobacteraeota bacterium]|nr:methylated-DNA--[protein]-cysteine S-methyltransferase [Candidatus Eremiobacteraeota bacterium]